MILMFEPVKWLKTAGFESLYNLLKVYVVDDMKKTHYFSSPSLRGSLDQILNDDVSSE